MGEQLGAERAGERRVLGALNFSRLQETLLGLVDLLLREAVLERPGDLFAEGCLQLRGVLRRVDGERRKRAGFVERADVHEGADAVAEPFLLANAAAEAGVETAAAKDRVGDDESGIAGIVVANPEIESGQEKGICLVRSLQRLIDRRDVLVQPRHAREARAALPVSEKL